MILSKLKVQHFIKFKHLIVAMRKVTTCMDTQPCEYSSVVGLLIKCWNSEADCLKVLSDEMFDNVKFGILPAASKCEIFGILPAAPKTQL